MKRIFFLILLLGMVGLMTLLFLVDTPNLVNNPKTGQAGSLFQAQNWSQMENEDGKIQYSDLGLRIWVRRPNYYLWSNPQDIRFQDVRIDVDIQKIAGPDRNDAGVICRYQDANNYYYFTISNAGYYKIGKVVNGTDHLVGMQDYQFDDGHIHRGDTSNHVQVECIGDKLALYANSTLLVQVQDRDLAAGNVGLIAGTWDVGGADIRFTNFSTVSP